MITIKDENRDWVPSQWLEKDPSSCFPKVGFPGQFDDHPSYVTRFSGHGDGLGGEPVHEVSQDSDSPEVPGLRFLLLAGDLGGGGHPAPTEPVANLKRKASHLKRTSPVHLRST